MGYINILNAAIYQVVLHLQTRLLRASLPLLLQLTLFTYNAHAQTCPTTCGNTIDYQHPTSLLHFSRSHKNTTVKTATAATSEETLSRHRFEVVFTQQGSSIVIFDHLGNQHIFDKGASGNFTSSSNSGSLAVEGGLARWTDPSGHQYHFQGSYLTKYIQKSGRSLSLRYRQQRLISITDDLNNTLALNYENDKLTGLTTPEGEVIKTRAVACNTHNDQTGTTCDTQKHPLVDFQSTPLREGVTRIDARPSSCNSYFVDYFGTDRGAEIELGLADLSPYNSFTPTVRSYPIVDFIDGNRLLVVRSRDLANSSFNDAANPNALLYRLLRDAREIQTRFLSPLTENGQVSAIEEGVTTTIDAGTQPPIITLQLVIRHQIASLAHWAQIARARDQLLDNYGIVLEVIIIP